jgi:transcriptional regulator GlxA family with amidase domain
MDPRVAAALSLIQTQPQTTTEALAVSVNLFPSRLRHVFRAEMSTSLCRYVREWRLVHAEELLRTTFLSIKQVSAGCGFRDPNHFRREFRRRFGLAPTAYRQVAGSDAK